MALRLAIIVVVIIGIAVVLAWRLSREHSMFEALISKFLRAGAAGNVRAAYGCWSRYSATEDDIARFIQSSHNVFAGYEQLSITDQRLRSGVGGSTEAEVSGVISYSGDRRLPFEARLVREKDAWRLTGIRIGSSSVFLA